MRMGAPAMTGGVLFTPEEEIASYRSMLRIRRFEERVGQLYALGVIHGLSPLSIGQEASIVGVLMAAGSNDRVITGSRGHGQMLMLGIEPALIMGELMGRTTGLSKGKGGSFRMFSRERHFFGGHRTPGVSAPLGAGLAFASRYRGGDEVCLCFLSAASSGKGRVFETYELAGAWKLPIVFVIDSNVAASGAETAKAPLADAGAPLGIPGEQIDGIDVRAARAAARRAIERARRGEGPMILEMLTYRYRGHEETARSGPGEKRREEADPIAKSRQRILDDAVASEAELKVLEKEVREWVNTAATAAKSSPLPEPHELTTSLQA